MRSVFSKCTVSWPLTSDRNDICFLLRTTKPNGSVDSRHGRRSSQPEIRRQPNSAIASPYLTDAVVEPSALLQLNSAIQIVASGTGGYLAGRLRTKWTAIHTDEVYFRDTAHGFLVWAVAVVMTATFLGSAATALVGGVAVNANAVAENAYLEGRLLRPVPPAAAVPGATEPAHSSTDLSVSQLAEQERRAAEAARKETGRFLLWTFLALLIGAFCASYAATIGGRQRDHLKAI